ncbi:MAG: addiction module antidote protein [Thermodesulfobacteriota bacterium]
MEDPEEATEYLTASLDGYEGDGNMEAFLLALRTVIDAQGGMTELARKTSLNRQNLYRTLSKNGNPRLQTLHEILNALGLRLSIDRVPPGRRRKGHPPWTTRKKTEMETPPKTE